MNYSVPLSDIPFRVTPWFRVASKILWQIAPKEMELHVAAYDNPFSTNKGIWIRAKRWYLTVKPKEIAINNYVRDGEGNIIRANNYSFRLSDPYSIEKAKDLWGSRQTKEVG